MNFKKTMTGLRQNYFRINASWFFSICSELEYDKEKIKQLYSFFTKGIFPFIENSPEELINRISDITEVEYDNNMFQTFLQDREGSKDFRKIIYEENEKLKFIELNFLDATHLLQLKDMLQSGKTDVKYVLRCIDEISESKAIRQQIQKRGYKKIYEYDIIGASESEWKNEKALYICYLQKHFPSYSELIWTKKYGFWNSEGKLHQEKNDQLKKILNINSDYSNYVVTGKDYYEVIGNLLLDKSILNPEKV